MLASFLHTSYNLDPAEFGLELPARDVEDTFE